MPNLKLELYRKVKGLGLQKEINAQFGVGWHRVTSAQLHSIINNAPAKLFSDWNQCDVDEDNVPLNVERYHKDDINLRLIRIDIPGEITVDRSDLILMDQIGDIGEYPKGRITLENHNRIYEFINEKFEFIYNEVNSRIVKFNITLVSTSNQNFNPFSYTEDKETLLEYLKLRLQEYAENYDDALYIDSFDISYFVNTSEIIKATNRALTEGTETWYIVDTATRKNCVFVALYTGLNWRTNTPLLTNSKLRINATTTAKSRLNKKTDLMIVTMNDMQELATLHNCKIITYDSLFNITGEFIAKRCTYTFEKDDSQGVCHMQINNGHAKCMILKKEILKVVANFKFDTTISESKYTSYKIIKTPKTEILNKKIASIDIETILINSKKLSRLGTDKQFIPYASGIAYVKNNVTHQYYIYSDLINKVHHQYNNEKSNDKVERIADISSDYFKSNLEQMFEYILDNIDTFANYTIYAHNGGKFDLLLMMRDVFVKNKDIQIISKGFVELNNTILGVTIRYKKKYLHFKDSYRMAQSSLKKLSKDLKVCNQKGDINHNLINIETYMGMENEIMPYLVNDVVGLLQCMTQLNNLIFVQFNINMSSCLTSASLAKRIFYKLYSFTKHGLYTLSLDEDKMIRESYNGGRCESFKLGAIEQPLYYYDFTSLYPYCGTKLLPVGECINIPDIKESIEYFLCYMENLTPKGEKRTTNKERTSFPKKYHKYFKNKKKLSDIKLGFIKCQVKGNKDDLNGVKPLHGIKDGGKLIFPYLENWTEITLFTEEIKLGLTLGYQYKPISACLFNRDVVMKRFFKSGFENKSEAQKMGNFALSYMWKIVTNSGYGFWGYNPYNKDVLKIFINKDKGWMQHLAEGKLKKYNKIGNYVFVNVVNTDIPRDTNVSIASAISSYGRIELYKLIHSIESKGYKVYYCDTDSVITNCKLSDYHDLMKKYRPDNVGESLGSLKNELGLLNDGTDIHFDKLINGGCKIYSLFANDKIWCAKFKGLKNFNTDGKEISDNEKNIYINKIINGGQTTQKQMMIMSNKHDYLASEEPLNLRYAHVLKTFKMNYTKGTVLPNGDIEPLVV